MTATEDAVLRASNRPDRGGCSSTERRLSGVVCVSCLVDRCFCGADMSTPRSREWPVRVSLRLGGRFAGRLHSVEAELTGELVPEGAVLGSQAGDLGAGGIEPLAERAGACALRGERGGRWFVLAEVADEVADLFLAVEPCPGDAGGVCDCGVSHGLSLASQ